MIAYILDSMDLSVKDILQFNNFQINEDIGYTNKGSLEASRKPNVSDDDFVILKNEDNQVVFIGICDTCDNGGMTTNYTVNLKQKETLFDRKIFCGDDNIIAEKGIEDFIAKEIKDNFITSGDGLIDKSFIELSVETHTLLAKRVETENGIYNLKTFLGNVKQYYGIFTDFIFKGRSLLIKIYKKINTPMNIATDISDITDYNETYEVTVLAKLIARWKIPDTEDEEGNLIIGSVYNREFFLLADRTISEDSNNPDRARGSIDSLYIETEAEEEMLQMVYDTFAANSYNHKITFNIVPSKLYPFEELYLGKECKIRTNAGIKESMITGLIRSSSTNQYQVTLGNLNVTLIEKLRRLEK